MKFAGTLLTAAGVAAIIVVSATSAFAQGTNLITLDENGNGFWNGEPLQYAVDPDPYSQMPTLHYFLPFGGSTNSPGDVVLLEKGNMVSDILRFDGMGGVWFFSERDAGEMPPFDLADVPDLPSVNIHSHNVVYLDEVGPEGQNGAVYTPVPGQPGWDQGFEFTYEFQSDVIPEPETWILASLGILILAMKLRAARR